MSSAASMEERSSSDPIATIFDGNLSMTETGTTLYRSSSTTCMLLIFLGIIAVLYFDPPNPGSSMGIPALPTTGLRNEILWSESWCCGILSFGHFMVMAFVKERSVLCSVLAVTRSSNDTQIHTTVMRRNERANLKYMIQ